MRKVDFSPYDLVRRIEIRLAELDIRKGEFHRESGISESSLSQWKNEQCAPTDKKIHQAAKYLETSYEYLKYGRQEKPYLYTFRNINPRTGNVIGIVSGVIHAFSEEEARDTALLQMGDTSCDLLISACNTRGTEVFIGIPSGSVIAIDQY